ncbi:hypothetical protein GGF31_007816 [Allomyces arbusculus]|nr:hypothetical protein GGF31_007816 [Allomyces arbusculus]
MAPPIFYGTAPPAPADSALDAARSAVPAFPGAAVVVPAVPALAPLCLHSEHDDTAANDDDPRIALLQPFLGKGCLPVAAKTAAVGPSSADDSPLVPGAKASPSLESSHSSSPPTTPVPIPPRPASTDGTDSDESPARRKGGVSSALGSTILASPPSLSAFAQYDLYRTGRTTAAPSPPPAPAQPHQSPVPVPPAAVAARLALPTLHITRDVPATAVLSSTPASLSERPAPTAPRSAPPSQSPTLSSSPLGSPPRRASLLRTAKVLRFPSSENVLTSPDVSPPPSPQPVPVPAAPLARKPSTGRSPRDAKFVGGSYAESLLSGRLPVPASLPIVFTASVSAMGSGMAPTPVTVDFPAQFYCDGGSSCTGGGGCRGADAASAGAGSTPTPTSSDGVKQQQQQWSPYVGAIDLAPAVLAQQVATASSKRRTRTVPSADSSSVAAPPTGTSPTDAPVPAPAPPTAKRARKRSTPSSSSSSTSSSSSDPDDPIPGGYRVPRTGQLQVIIKNPERTAVKVFLVPYNCSELSARSKTVVRVTQYAVLRADPRTRSLRYALQVPFVMTRARRLYVSGAIRVVFAGSAIESYEELVTEVDRPLGVAAWSPPGTAKKVVKEEGVEWAAESGEGTTET